MNEAPEDNNEIVEVTKQWLDVLMSNFNNREGLPLGKLRCEVNRCERLEETHIAC